MKAEQKHSLVEALISEKPVSFALRNYDKVYADILNDKITDELSDTLKSCKYTRDKRTELEYAKELVLSWIVEDYAMELINHQFPTFRNGVDRERKFLANGKIGTAPDLIVSDGTDNIYVEIICDYYGFWNNKGVGHLRDSKLKHLKELSKIKKVYLLAIDLKNQQYCFIQIREDTHSRKIDCHPAFGGKPAEELIIDTRQFKHFNHNKKAS